MNRKVTIFIRPEQKVKLWLLYRLSKNAEVSYLVMYEGTPAMLTKNREASYAYVHSPFFATDFCIGNSKRMEISIARDKINNGSIVPILEGGQITFTARMI